MEVTGRVLELKIVEKKCKPCQQEDVLVKADGLCEDCEEYMCSSCFKHHLRFKFSKNHTFTITEEVENSSAIRKSNVQLCKEHQERIKLYCRKHKVVGCAECMVMKHKTCQLKYVSDVAKDFRNSLEFKGMLNKLGDLEKRNTQNVIRQKDIYKNVGEQAEIARQQLAEFRHEIEDAVKTAEARVLENLKDEENKIQAMLNELEEENGKSESEIGYIGQMLNEDAYSDNELFISSCNLNDKLSIVNMKVSTIEKRTHMKDFAFTRDRVLQKMMTDLQKLGTINTDDSAVVKDKCTTDRSNGFYLHIRGLPAERTIDVWVKDSETIKDVKMKIFTECGQPVEEQTLSQELLGKTLQDNVSINEYNFKPGTNLRFKRVIPAEVQNKDTKET